ncbi:hypothetical protein LTR49_028479 [Elasticomyces elasticus]|nr:hypothetical protein LTR49_028479 [Elasticomyces elasticus]
MREAEIRFPALLPYCIIFLISYVIGAVGYQKLYPQPTIFVYGFGSSSLSVTAIPTVVIAYAVDWYKPIRGEIMVVATVLKNMLGFHFKLQRSQRDVQEQMRCGLHDTVRWQLPAAGSSNPALLLWQELEAVDEDY